MLMPNTILFGGNTQTITMLTGPISMATSMPIPNVFDQDP